MGNARAIVPDRSLFPRWRTACGAWTTTTTISRAAGPTLSSWRRFASLFVCGSAGVMVQKDILLHLVNHATYHHGFVSTLLYPHKTKGAGYAIVGARHP